MKGNNFSRVSNPSSGLIPCFFNLSDLFSCRKKVSARSMLLVHGFWSRVTKVDAVRDAIDKREPGGQREVGWLSCACMQ